jgi:histidine ammonia-lyase
LGNAVPVVGRAHGDGSHVSMILLNGSRLTLDELLAIADDYHLVGLAPDAVTRVDRSRAVVDRQALGDTPIYGINTGFGALAETAIPHDALGALQVNLLRSHAAGVGEALPARAVRAAMALRANVLAKGFSGIRRSTLERLLDMLNRRVHPRVPSRGSVGASGDLAPLAHLSLVLIGEGHASVAEDATIRSGRDALAVAGLAPVTLGPKEGLALINGTQPSTAVAALAVAGADRLARAADVAAALSIDALRGSLHPFEARIHDARPYPGQITSAGNIRGLLADSAINRSHEHCGRVQDAYSMRCAAQVHGAAREAFTFARTLLMTEANAATDNPMVFPGESEDQDEIVSGGNFHGAPVAIAADVTAIALAQLATISERRSDRLVNPALSGLPAFLTAQSGLQSGYMMAQVTAAALTSEIKTLAHPASVDTIPTSANREDHVSMSMGAALKAAHALELASRVVAVEILCACQAIDLLAPLTTSPLLARVHAHVREAVPALTIDRPPAPDIEAIAVRIANGSLLASIAAEVK